MTIMANDGTLPLSYDLELYHGDTFRQGFRLNDSDLEYYDLTGCTALSDIRYSPAMATVVIPVNAYVDEDQVTNKGVVWVEIPFSNFAAAPRFPEMTEFATWDLQIVWPSGDKLTYLAGTVSLRGDSTHG